MALYSEEASNRRAEERWALRVPHKHPGLPHLLHNGSAPLDLGLEQLVCKVILSGPSPLARSFGNIAIQVPSMDMSVTRWYQDH